MKNLENGNRLAQNTARDFEDLMQNVLDQAKKLGATDAAVAVDKEHGFSVNVRMSEVESVTFNDDNHIGVTIYIGQRKGSASSTDTSAEAIEHLVKAAYEIAQVSAEDPCFGLADKELMTNDYPNLDLNHPWSINPPEAIETILNLEKEALSLDKRIVNSDGANLSTHQFFHAFSMTNGAHAFIEGTKHSLSCSLIAKQGKSMQRDYDYTVSRTAEELMSPQQIAKSVVDRTTSRLGAKQIKTQKAPVLFSSRVSAGLLGSFIAAISGSNLYRKHSFLMDCLGKQVFPKGFKIYEQPRILRALGSSPFDGEGVPTRNNVFVDDGKVCLYVMSTYPARKMGYKTSANSGGVHNLTLDPTAGDLDSLIKQMDKGLLVTELMGQGINGMTGDYSRGASGYWVENGLIQYPVEEITIAGNLKDMFKHIVAVGSDIDPNRSTKCGSLLIEELMIAGK